MNLSDLQNKEVIDISSGKRMGNIIDVIINRNGEIVKFVLEEKRGSRHIFASGKDEVYILWKQIVRIGDDIILVNYKENELQK